VTKLPTGWAHTSIKDVADTASGGTPLRIQKTYFGGNVLWFKSGELNDSILPAESEERLTETGVQNSSVKQFPSGAVLIAMYGATVGRLGILQAPATTNQAVCGIIPGRELENKFLFYFLLSQRGHLLSKRVGGAQPNINQQLIRELTIPLPPPGEQRRIVPKSKSSSHG
jgi:type I restriction enzyme S subunit